MPTEWPSLPALPGGTAPLLTHLVHCGLNPNPNPDLLTHLVHCGLVRHPPAPLVVRRVQQGLALLGQALQRVVVVAPNI